MNNKCNDEFNVILGDTPIQNLPITVDLLNYDTTFNKIITLGNNCVAVNFPGKIYKNKIYLLF